MRRRTFGGCLVLLAAMLASQTAAAVPPPWSRTEEREPCAAFETFRQPFFGDTHVHTAYSSDAVFAGTRSDPRAAYRFAQGEAIGLPPYDAEGNPTRSAQLRRPLDFTAVTDHAEQFGEIQMCLTPGLPGYDSTDCQSARAQLATPPPALPALLPPLPVIQFLLGYGVVTPPQRFSWCGPDGADCLAEASLVWEDTQSAAEEFYDRTAACSFTTFVGYEWSGQPGGNNLHRNVIFRNATVPALPTSYMEQPTPEGLWSTLASQCLESLDGCDVLAIPHNPNVSGGLMFVPPASAEAAAFRASMEPLVEMNQHKGDSECRPGVQSTDELCGFEKNNRLQLFSPISNPDQSFPARNYVRNVLREGLSVEQQLGVNPFKFGLIGSTDTHNATPGATEEADFGAYGHIGLRDHANPAYMLQRVTPAGIEATPGGLAVVWAEENSRDALFAAMRRREAYGTSGTRPILRFFAGAEPDLRCGDAGFVAAGYEGGVPMGGEIGPVRGGDSPRFGVLAFRDPGTATQPGTPLERVQIVKGWVDAGGQTHEKVFDVAGAAGGGGVDLATCTPTGTGNDSLCAVWTDPEFDPSRRAFYYARVLENPTCRWSTHLCNAQGVDCSVPASVPAELAECCNAQVPKTIQERAWSSPIWYRPEGVSRVRGVVRRGSGTLRGDQLRLRIDLGALPANLDLATQPLTVSVRDDDVILEATFPAGSLTERRPGRFSYADRTGSIGGVRSVKIVSRNGGAAIVRVKTIPMDLSRADAADHFIEVALRSGTVDVRTTPFWRLQSGSLVARW